MLDTEIPSQRFNNLTKDERNAMYSLKNDKSIIIKGAGKGAAVIVWETIRTYRGLPGGSKQVECTCEHYI